jgi:endonuclease/exonuclease/phosphatase (EEP) superfamily protein YafD
MIRVISYNVLFGRRSKKIFPWLAKQTNVDIICLQEFPERKIEACMDMLPGYKWVFAPSMRIFKKVYGELTLYRTDRVTLKNTHVIDLGPNRIEKAILRTHLPRTALLTEFVYKRKRFILVNLQLVSLASNKLRYGQIQLILAAVKTYRIPICLIGDFNIPSLRAKNKLIAYMKLHRFTMPQKRTPTYRIAFIKYQLDYAFARNGKITTFEMERIRFSDHYPVHVEMAI